MSPASDRKTMRIARLQYIQRADHHWPNLGRPQLLSTPWDVVWTTAIIDDGPHG